jgi:hypothetical protein
MLRSSSVSDHCFHDDANGVQYCRQIIHWAVLRSDPIENRGLCDQRDTVDARLRLNLSRCSMLYCLSQIIIVGDDDS